MVTRNCRLQGLVLRVGRFRPSHNRVRAFGHFMAPGRKQPLQSRSRIGFLGMLPERVARHVPKTRRKSEAPSDYMSGCLKAVWLKTFGPVFLDFRSEIDPGPPRLEGLARDINLLGPSWGSCLAVLIRFLTSSGAALGPDRPGGPPNEMWDMDCHTPRDGQGLTWPR